MLILDSSDRATEIINHRGTVEATVYYPDKTVYERFMALERKCRALLSTSSESGPLSTVISMIDSDKNIQKHCLQMQEMAAQLRNMARKERYSGKVPKTAKHLQKRFRKEQQRLTGTEVNPTIVAQNATVAQVSPKATDEKPKRKKKKTKAKGAAGLVMTVQDLAARFEKPTKMEVVVGKGGLQAGKVEEAGIPALRGDVGHLGRVEIVIPSFFEAISGIFGFSS